MPRLRAGHNFSSAVDSTAGRNVTHEDQALPDSGSNAARRWKTMVAEMRGFPGRCEHIRLVCGRLGPRAVERRYEVGRWVAQIPCKERHLQSKPTNFERPARTRRRLASENPMLAKLDDAGDGASFSAAMIQEEHTFAIGQKQPWQLIRQTGRGPTGGERTATKQRRGSVLCRSGSRYLDRAWRCRSIGLYRTID